MNSHSQRKRKRDGDGTNNKNSVIINMCTVHYSMYSAQIYNVFFTPLSTFFARYFQQEELFNVNCKSVRTLQ